MSNRKGTWSLRRLQRWMTVVGAGTAVLLIAACGSGDPTATPTSPAATPTPESAMAAWEIELEQLIVAAQEEGEVRVDQARSEVFKLDEMWDGFESKYGIKVTIARGSGREQLDRMLAERSAGLYNIDLIIAGLGSWRDRILPAGVLAPVMDILFLPEVVDPSNWRDGILRFIDTDRKFVFLYGAAAGPASITYNTDLVSASDVESFNSYQDLLDPKWKGKIVTGHPLLNQGDESGRAGMYYHPDLGPEFLRRMYTEMDMTLVASDREKVDGVASGAFHLLFMPGAAGRTINAMKQDGLPVSPLERNLEVLGLGVGGTSSVGAVDRAAHPNAQKLLLNWMLTREGQELFTQTIVDKQSIRADISQASIDSLPALYRIPEGPLNLPDADPEAAERQVFVTSWMKDLMQELGL